MTTFNSGYTEIKRKKFNKEAKIKWSKSYYFAKSTKLALNLSLAADVKMTKVSRLNFTKYSAGSTDVATDTCVSAAYSRRHTKHQ